jgi:hypothetical protein
MSTFALDDVLLMLKIAKIWLKHVVYIIKDNAIVVFDGICNSLPNSVQTWYPVVF